MNKEQFIEKYYYLIPKVLKSCYIFTFNPNYEDYKQIAYEALIRSYHQHPIATVLQRLNGAFRMKNIVNKKKYLIIVIGMMNMMYYLNHLL